MVSSKDISALLKEKEDKEKAIQYQRFFKTAPGEYGYGDIFWGITVPEQRKIVKKIYKNVILENLEDLIKSQVHEERLTALLILVEKYQKTKNNNEKEEIVQLYLKSYNYINNWDLVDLTAPKILGDYLKDKDRIVLYQWAESGHLWKQRISIISTFTFIKNEDYNDLFAIADILLNHTHDLIHKAVGWMLREAGKKNITAEKDFLRPRYKKMPRTMLRYAIEKFPEEERQNWLKGKI